METNELVAMLNGYFCWNKARMKYFTGLLIGLIKVRTVNLVELACAFVSEARMESRGGGEGALEHDAKMIPMQKAVCGIY